MNTKGGDDMAEFKKFRITMEAEGQFPVKMTLEADNPDEEFVLLQQKRELESLLSLINEQLGGKV